MTKLLLEAGFGNYAGDTPTHRRVKAIRIPLREKTAHTGVLELAASKVRQKRPMVQASFGDQIHNEVFLAEVVREPRCEQATPTLFR